MIGPRHSTIEADPRAAALQGSENARDTDQALRRKLTAHWVFLDRYVATGNAATLIPLGVSAMPAAVLLVNAKAVQEKVSLTPPPPVTAAQGGLGFVWDSSTRTLSTPEPTGLVPGEVYALTYLVGEKD